MKGLGNERKQNSMDYSLFKSNCAIYRQDWNQTKVLQHWNTILQTTLPEDKEEVQDPVSNQMMTYCPIPGWYFGTDGKKQSTEHYKDRSTVASKAIAATEIPAYAAEASRSCHVRDVAPNQTFVVASAQSVVGAITTGAPTTGATPTGVTTPTKPVKIAGSNMSPPPGPGPGVHTSAFTAESPPVASQTGQGSGSPGSDLQTIAAERLVFQAFEKDPILRLKPYT